MIGTNKISSMRIIDIRFPTSELMLGVDAANKSPDYSAAYLELETEQGDRGYGLIFTIGRGNEICCQMVSAMRHLVVGRDFDDIRAHSIDFYNELRNADQLRWLGPEKGVIHLATSGIMNAVWDMWARREKKPVWRLLMDMSPEEFVACMDFRYVRDVLDPSEALNMVRANEATKLERLKYLKEYGYPCYTTSPGWLGYSDEKLHRLCRQAVQQGFQHIKLKVGQDLKQDIHRCAIARKAVGADVKLMVDANQSWEVAQAIEWINQLSSFNLWFVEEPTSPDDILGHKKIKQNINDVLVATGEHCQNRILFKQFISSDAIDIVQIDACRLASINEILTVLVLAAKYGKPVCPHAGGVGLCEYVQHLSIIDYLRISADCTGRVSEYVEHLHEHFETPCRIRNGAYLVPEEPGFSVKMRPQTLLSHEYPTGVEWRKRVAE